MKIACLCPTYRRPSLLPTALFQFLHQQCPGHELRLFVLDDAGQYDNQTHDAWALHSVTQRFATMGSKHNALIELAQEWEADVCCQWDDDDLYLPLHVSNHVAALTASTAAWSIPRTKRIQTPAGITIEHHDRPWCHGSWAYRISAAKKINGYDERQRDDFDLDFGARLLRSSGEPADATGADPQYVYRWGVTGSRNVSSFAKTGSYYYCEASNNGVSSPHHGLQITPKLDSSAEKVWSALGVQISTHG